MNLEVNQNNLYLFLPSKVCWLGDMLANDKDLTLVDAIKEIYSSDLYKKLEQEDTKLWHLGPVALYQDLKDSLFA